ncbi:UDP-N-acetylmuramate dehydrogenase [Corynebacterium silvaticum]|uniref:UDP-N-acetylenolpyruvoylglucosamine reductase n=1 Tax=Corynebacterium silvaticum TaxID=2320431 RepID=A0A7Y4LIC9_9CORY|nr:UDP-N-acetylmuramate dehydrogenase [Corynebacterium silvaticum]ARU45431.1 UDP-N-acetylmuramate dehydrogenase [Corynebacterium silvaticum]MBH5300003.1 UDP-N-acetylmuramate dehydrogenase [Corynebacterium silvaticum]NOM65472.1 UDP-N-acetylmuramate dehydrogenase [Corynebacterium silvaticum]NON70629.1 UDP-N-acetylmuramate dehydrogenase [Corynebacterium silvaticum]TFA92328.1 UDP-N-acetylmuramate dehydrogenase [Corynebacterium silvaticum]
MTDTSLTQTFAEIRPEIERHADTRIESLAFSELTTFHLGGTPIAAVHCGSREAVAHVVRLLDAHRIPLLIVGGGSNLVIADGDIPVVAVIVECEEISADMHTGRLVVDAGAVWDDVVAFAVDAGLGGIECLSGIPGSAGATPVQNVGAYGAEIADVLVSVELLDRGTGEVSEVPAAELELAYRYSNLKFTGRAVVLGITLQLSLDGLSAPLRFGELARLLGVAAPGEEAIRWNVREVREAVVQLRRGKGMVYDPDDHDTWSAGSFFTNPIVSDALLETVRTRMAELCEPEDAAAMPCYPMGPGAWKLSAAWLIDRAGYKKGYPEGAPARLSTKHTLALTNRGNATTTDLVALAHDICDGVQKTFGVALEPEPVWIGVEF